MICKKCGDRFMLTSDYNSELVLECNCRMLPVPEELIDKFQDIVDCFDGPIYIRDLGKGFISHLTAHTSREAAEEWQGRTANFRDVVINEYK